MSKSLLFLAAAVGVLASGCVSQGRYAALEAQLVAAQQQLVGEQQKEAETQQRLVTSNDDVALLRRQMAALSAKMGTVPPPVAVTRNMVEPPMPVTLTFHRLPDHGGFQVRLSTSAPEKFGVRVAVIHHPSGITKRFRVFIPTGEQVLLGGDQPAIVDPDDEITVAAPNFSKLDIIFRPVPGE